MCDPATIAGVALSAVGSGLSAMEQQKNAERGAAARQAAAEAELQRQKVFRDEAQPMVASATQQTGAQQSLADLLSAQTKRTDAMTGAVTPETYTPALPSGGDVNREVVRKMAEAASGARDNAARAGKLQGWGDVGANQGLNLASTARGLNTVTDLAGGSVRLLPFEQDVAEYNATRKGPGMLGDLLGLAGKGIGLAGMTGFNPFKSGPSLGGLGSSTGASRGFGLRQ